MMFAAALAISLTSPLPTMVDDDPFSRRRIGAGSSARGIAQEDPEGSSLRPRGAGAARVGTLLLQQRPMPVRGGRSGLTAIRAWIVSGRPASDHRLRQGSAHDGCHRCADVCDFLLTASSPYAGRTMRYTTAIVAAAMLTSSFMSPIGAQDESVQPGPRAIGETVAYRLNLETTGTQQVAQAQAQTTLTLTRTQQGVRVSSSSPAEETSANVGDDGVVRIDGHLRTVVGPYNQIQTALRGRDRNSRSTVNVLVGGREVSVPVAFTSTESGGTTSLVFTGQTTTRVKGVGAHVAVDVQATVVRGHIESASARNAFDASVPFRKIHIDQVWSLTRLP
jgi:hypothetical protein